MKCPTCGNDLPFEAVFCPKCSTPVEGAEECTDYVYEAFISYRHHDVDRTAAVKIQKAVEGYRIPKQLQEEAGRKRLGKCFRDEDELPTSASLSEQILDALKRSRYLIVVCTPRTRESLWVQREVTTYASLHGRDRIIVALAEGEPSESFPELLLSATRIGEDGTVEEYPTEPIAADFRNLSRKKFNVEKLRIISSLIGCNFDDLRQRERLRRNKIIATASAGIAAVSLAFGAFATYQQMQITQSYREIQVEKSEFLAQESNELLESGDRYQAVQVALSALPQSSTSDDRPYVPAAQLALEQSSGVYPSGNEWAALYSQTNLYQRGLNPVFVVNEDGIEASVSNDWCIEIREVATGNLICRFDAAAMLDVPPDDADPRYYMGMKVVGEKLVVTFGDVVGCFLITDGSLLWSTSLEGIYPMDCAMAFTSDADTVAITVLDGHSGKEGVRIHLIDMESGEVSKEIALPGYMEAGLESSPLYEYPDLAFSPDDSELLVGIWGGIYAVDVSKGTYEVCKLHFGSELSIAFIDDGIAAFSWDNDTGNLVDRDVCLEFFDSNLELRWEYIAHEGSKYDTKYGYLLTLEYGAYGTWDYFDDGSEQVVVIFGDELLLFDSETGETVLSIPSDTSYLDCLVTESRGRKRIFATSSDGTVMCRLPRESNSGNGGTVGDTVLLSSRSSYFDVFETGGRIYCSLVMTNTFKRAVFRFELPADLMESQPLGSDSEVGSTHESWFWNDTTLVRQRDDNVVFLDRATLEALTEIPLSRLERLDTSALYEMDCGDNAIYVFGRLVSEDDNPQWQYGLFRIDGSDASITQLKTIEGISSLSLTAFAGSDGRDLLMLTGYLGSEYGVMLVDPSLDPENCVIAAFDVDGVRKAWYAGDTLVVCRSDYGDERGRGYFCLVDSQTGESTECDLEQYQISDYYEVDSCCALSKDRSAFACVCSDGALRAFDTTTGALLWETFETPSNVQFLTYGKNEGLFVQDIFGKCVLVSASTGTILKASNTTVPPIKSAVNNVDTDDIVAFFTDNGLNGDWGIVVMTLTEDSFGPKSILYNTLYITEDETRYICEDTYTRDLYVARKLTLDELISYGNELVVGHELTDADLHLYQISE